MRFSSEWVIFSLFFIFVSNTTVDIVSTLIPFTNNLNYNLFIIHRTCIMFLCQQLKSLYLSYPKTFASKYFFNLQYICIFLLFFLKKILIIINFITEWKNIPLLKHSKLPQIMYMGRLLATKSSMLSKNFLWP